MGVKKLDYNGLQTLVSSLKDFVRKHAGIPIGTEFFTTNPNVPDGALPLLGGGIYETFTLIYGIGSKNRTII